MQNKIACVNDISGLGKCSLTVALPIISALKCQCCPMPTSVLSAQTGFSDYSLVDLTDNMDIYLKKWSKLDVKFDAIYSGFLSSVKQIGIVEKLISNYPEAMVVIDPIMGDNGLLFRTFTIKFVQKMKRLVSSADLITPNITEANLLLGRKIDKLNYTDKELKELCIDLANMGPKMIVITGVISDGTIYNISYEKDGDKFDKIGTPYDGKSYSGTGDIFTSIITALVVRGFDLKEAIEKATDFISTSVAETSKDENRDRNMGICFEPFIDMLTRI